jgi:hypothetical protein
MKMKDLVWVACLVLAGSELGIAQQRRARQQPTVPEAYREMPFIETAVEPVLNDEERERGFLLFQRPIMEPVYPNTHPRAHERVVELQAFAAQDEFEPLTFSLYPVRDLKNMRVRVSNLNGDAGKIGAEQISVRLATYWNMGFPRYTSRETYRRLPELLEQVTEHSSPAKECQRWWLTVHVPAGTKAGLYRGTVTVSDDVTTKPLEIPLSLRVLPFSLKQDPAKHYSAYYYARNKVAFEGKEEAFIDKATANEYRAMRDAGLDMMPTLSIWYDQRTQRLEMSQGEEIERMMAAGLKGPIPVTGGIDGLYRKMTPGGKVESHWRIENMPPPAFYTKVTEAYRAFDAERKQRGWPEMVFAPIDEVAESHKEFGWRVYKALKDAGVRTYATKNPLSADAADYAPYVDVWCSQPYSMAYEKIIAQQQHEFWSYPNHNAGEIKNRRVMCKGGRMTYGFGFWRSGYTTLIPWHWSWTPAPDPFDYLRGKHSGAGNRIGDDGEVIPAIYWECFREGFDDARYVYTLQQAVWERQGSQDKKCLEAIQRAQARLQQTWDAIEVQQKYLEDDMWPSDEFNARRWTLAKSIQELQAFPLVRKGDAPSVTVNVTQDTGKVQAKPTPLERAIALDKVRTEDLGKDFSQWKNSTKEGEIEVTDEAGLEGRPGMRWKVGIDHRLDGGEGGAYPVGWPRMRRQFSKGELDLAAWDILEFMVRVDSDRDEVADDSTPLGFTMGSHASEQRLIETRRELGDRQRVWIPLRFPIADLMSEAAVGAEPWKSVSYAQIFISESDFPDKTKLTIDIGGIRLFAFTEPVIARAEVEQVIMLPRRSLPISLNLMGTRAILVDSHRVKMTLTETGSGKVAVQDEWPLQSSDQQQVVLDISKLQPGKYRWQINLMNANSGEIAVDKPDASGELEALEGPFFE